MAEHLRVINKEPSRFDDLTMTETARDIIRTLDFILGKPGAITMIATIPGAGKSATITAYDHWATHREGGDLSCTWLHTAVAGEGQIWNVTDALMNEFFGVDANSRRMRECRRKIAKYIGKGNMLIIDEAQYLEFRNPRGKNHSECFEWFRAMAVACDISIAFVGDLSLLKAVGQ